MRYKLFFLSSLFLIISFNGCGGNKNSPPVINDVIPKITKTNVENKIRFTCKATDKDGSPLSYNWTSSSGSFPDGNNNSIAYWRAPAEAGSCTIKVTVSDGMYSDEFSFSVMVEMKEENPTPLVGVYYYPWYGGSNFHGGKYLREHLTPVQIPELGEYNDRESDVIKQHLAWSNYARIGLWVCSWWGPGKLEDITLKDYILKHPDLNDIKIALFYETSGRMPNFTDLSNVASDISYMAKNYFSNPNYYNIDGRPVLFIYLTRVLSNNGTLKNTLKIMRDVALDAGFDIYIVGDQVFGQPPSSTDQIALLDAITNYDVYGSSGGRTYATQEKVTNYYAAQAGWRSKAHQAGVRFIPATSPGFNDRGVRDGHIPLSRKLSQDDEFGSLFKQMVNEAMKITDSETDNLFMVTSWNEWHEDTQIEPVASSPATNKDDSESGQDYTTGLEYEGYGLRYLDILKQAVSK